MLCHSNEMRNERQNRWSIREWKKKPEDSESFRECRIWKSVKLSTSSSWCGCAWKRPVTTPAESLKIDFLAENLNWRFRIVRHRMRDKRFDIMKSNEHTVRPNQRDRHKSDKASCRSIQPKWMAMTMRWIRMSTWKWENENENGNVRVSVCALCKFSMWWNFSQQRSTKCSIFRSIPLLILAAYTKGSAHIQWAWKATHTHTQLNNTK